MPEPLSDHERATLLHFRDHEEPSLSRRAQIVLMHEEQDATTAEIAAAVGLSRSWVNHWRRAWNESRLGIFPPMPETEPPTAVEIEPARPGIDEPRLALELSKSVGLLPDDHMAEAGRKVLLYHFERMLLNEPASRLGEDIEGVHDMRVATRRMRSALRLFQPFFDADSIHPFRKGLRQIAGLLGEVRDLDVFIEKTQRFLQKHPKNDLSLLLEERATQRDKTRATLIDHLDSKSFDRLVTRFHEFLTTPGSGIAARSEDGAITAYQLRHIAPRLIYEHFEQVRAYETAPTLAEVLTLHALRIDFKRLRYALEFFEEVLGPQAKQVINQVKTMQDHLGDLNDAEVASGILNEFIRAHNETYSGIPGFMRPNISGIVAYAAAREAEKQHLLDTFPKAWGKFLRDEVRHNLALGVAVL